MTRIANNITMIAASRSFGVKTIATAIMIFAAMC